MLGATMLSDEEYRQICGALYSRGLAKKTMADWMSAEPYEFGRWLAGKPRKKGGRIPHLKVNQAKGFEEGLAAFADLLSGFLDRLHPRIQDQRAVGQ